MTITIVWLEKPCVKNCPAYLDNNGQPMQPIMCRHYHYCYDFNGIKDCKSDSMCEPLCTEEKVEYYKELIDDIRN